MSERRKKRGREGREKGREEGREIERKLYNRRTTHTAGWWSLLVGSLVKTIQH